MLPGKRGKLDATKVNYFIYAKHSSGSMNGVTYYHKNGMKTLEQFQRDVENIEEKQRRQNRLEEPPESKIIYLHWASECWEVDENDTRRGYVLKLGCDHCTCTYPDTIIDWLQNNYDICDEYSKIKLLYIITDGLVCQESAKKCFKLNESMQYETVVLHVLNEDTKSVDLSVAASFFKSRCIVYLNYRLYVNTDVSKEFDYDTIKTYNFSAKKNQLKSYITLKFIKDSYKPDAVTLHEIDKLKKLRDRLFAELTPITVNCDKGKVNLETRDRNVFLREFVDTDWYKNLTAPDYMVKVDIEKSISSLINYIVSDSKSYSFNALKFDKDFTRFVETEEIANVNFTPEQEIEFPDVILDDDKGIPVIILAIFNLMDKIIFHGEPSSGEMPAASFSKFKSTMECPLFLIKDQDVSESIGYFYTLNVYKQLLANNTKTDPRTRRPFHGGLVLTDTDQFDKYNDYVLSATYFDGKKVNYNVGLFYFVLWKNSENKEWMDRNVVEQFKKYTMRRISKTVCKIGLSSLPLDPPEKTSLLTALWYCVELSSCIFKNDPRHFKHERLRAHHSVACYMIEILKHFNYDLDLESIEKRRELISHVMTLKKIQKYREKAYYLLKRIFKTTDGFLVSEIENPSNVHTLNYLKCDHKEMLRDDIIEQKVHLNDYVHLMHYEGDLEALKAGEHITFEICEKTFRPFFVIDHNKSFYTEAVKNTRRVVINIGDNKDKVEVSYEAIDSLEFNRILSLYKLFIDCVKLLGTYPTLPEYVEYIVKRKKFHGDLVTIFCSNVYLGIKDVYERYQKVVTKVGVKEFNEVCKDTVNRFDRIKAEERVKFSNDDEINEFISNEELKVNLKKNKVNLF